MIRNRSDQTSIDITAFHGTRRNGNRYLFHTAPVEERNEFKVNTGQTDVL